MDTKKLRQKILDLAIRGKLVPQDPNDEPASVLLERIRAEKEQLIKEGKIKRSKKSAASDTSHYENVPFEVPENWEWTTLENICSKIGSGSTPRGSNYSYEGIPFFRSQNVHNNGLCYDDIKYIDDETHQCMTSTEVHPGDVLLNITGGSLGRCAVVPSTFDIGNVSQHVCILRPILVISEYLHAFILSGHFHKNMKVSGSGREGLPKYNLEKMVFPLPPFDEQARIVNQVQNLMYLIDDINANRDLLEKNIYQYKQEVLDLAISGKLNTQLSTDIPALEILKAINPSYSATDNRHYENVRYPGSWKVIKMGELVRIISGVAYSKSDVTVSGIKVIRGGNIQAGEIIECDDDVYIDNRYADPINNIYKGDIVLVASTGSQQLIGKTGFARRDYVQTQIGAFLRILRSKDIRCADFLNLVFQSDYYRQYIRSLAKGTNINNVKNSYIEDFVIGLPPLQEQNRIVAFTNKIFYMIDEILAGL